MNFEFATAGRILFGAGRLVEVAPLVRSFGTRALVVTGSRPERAARLVELLQAGGITVSNWSVAGEPTVADVQAGADHARIAQAECVLGFGGGSPIDAAKAIAALTTNHDDPLEYLEVIGRARPLPHEPLPTLAIPTTAGTGAEVTRNAVLGSAEHRVKVSLRHPRMLPRIALVDPELTLDLPPALTATTGLDAVTQLIEPWISCRANPLTDGLCREGLKRAVRSLVRAFRDGTDVAARTDLCVASLHGGLALANAGLGVVHGFAGPMGGMFPVPHGALCAALLASALDVNLRALRQRAPQSDSLRRFAELAETLTGTPGATAEAAVAWVRELTRALAIRPLSSFGIRAADHAAIVEKAQVSSSLKANPLPLTVGELHAILEAAS